MSNQNETVLITGASTGIGRAVASEAYMAVMDIFESSSLSDAEKQMISRCLSLAPS